MKLYQIFPEAQARAIGQKIATLSWSTGKARTKELTGSIKRNGEILSHTSLQMIGKRIVNHPEIQLDHIPLQLHPPKFSRYREGEFYKAHTDAPWMGRTRTDLSCTLWLSDEYEGGELVVAGERFRGKPGECLIYDCGEIHEVTPVTSGERICAVSWLQSRVRDRHKRTLISDFRRFLAKLESSQSLFVEGGRVHSALLRMWIE